MSRDKGSAIMHAGSVKWFSVEKGYGFIRPDADFGGDVYVALKALERSPLASLETGQRIAFDFEKDSKGRLRATKLGELAPTPEAA